MSSGDYTSTFLKKLREYERLMKFASYRYSVPGLDPDDMYQEALLILDKMLRKYDFDPDSSDFRKMFKTELWHGLWNVMHRYKVSKRSWKKVVHFDYHDLDTKGPLDSRVSIEAVSSNSTPETHVIASQANKEIEKFIQTLTERLDDDAQRVLAEILNPKSWDEIPEEFKENQFGDDYWRTPKKKVPLHVIAYMLDWSHIRVRRAMRRIRREAKELGGELGLPLISAAKSRHRRKRAD